MKAHLMLIAVLGLGFTYVPAGAQICGGESGGPVGSCQIDGCFGQYDAGIPPGSMYRWAYIVELCCNTPVQVWTTEYGGCSNAELQSNEAQATLAFLVSHGIDVMVKDCHGHFVHYVPPGQLSARG